MLNAVLLACIQGPHGQDLVSIHPFPHYIYSPVSGVAMASNWCSVSLQHLKSFVRFSKRHPKTFEALAPCTPNNSGENSLCYACRMVCMASICDPVLQVSRKLLRNSARRASTREEFGMITLRSCTTARRRLRRTADQRYKPREGEWIAWVTRSSASWTSDKRTSCTDVIVSGHWYRARCMNSISQIIIHPKNMQLMERLAFLLSWVLQLAIFQI